MIVYALEYLADATGKSISYIKSTALVQSVRSSIDAIIYEIAQKRILQTSAAWAVDGLVGGAIVGVISASIIINKGLEDMRKDKSSGLVQGLFWIGGLSIGVAGGAICGITIMSVAGASKAALFH
ncbi:MAG: hypothetical protein K0S07_1423 [Chlamydiales bacterium]|jgi:hypothetical protein|nr:hypothetical protein [Chlamydiales bacterium]